jgi:hypothetical protein
MLAWNEVHRKPAYWMGGARRRDGASSIWAFMRNCRNLRHQGSRSSAPTQDPEYRCDDAGADRFVVAVTVL